MSTTYLETTKNVYKKAAETPDVGLLYYNTCLAVTWLKNPPTYVGDELWLW